MTCLFLHIIMHLLLFLSPDWLTFCHMIIYLSYINSLSFLFIFCFSLTKWAMLETLDYTIRIGSTPTFLYFDLYLYSAYAAHKMFIKLHPIDHMVTLGIYLFKTQLAPA